MGEQGKKKKKGRRRRRKWRFSKKRNKAGIRKI
jgi:hypothetical protein